jgi:hypothetical protein
MLVLLLFIISIIIIYIKLNNRIINNINSKIENINMTNLLKICNDDINNNRYSTLTISEKMQLIEYINTEIKNSNWKLKKDNLLAVKLYLLNKYR